ncbi:hypothetical protein BDW74DRAFT_157656 [Aspergillus multicolor]|uniref:uncharacterized protein n=1 Tax=Aspergillus multicolor TaxID=41759 RepID=UPI003CCE3A48
MYLLRWKRQFVFRHSHMSPSSFVYGYGSAADRQCLTQFSIQIQRQRRGRKGERMEIVGPSLHDPRLSRELSDCQSRSRVSLRALSCSGWLIMWCPLLMLPCLT